MNPFNIDTHDLERLMEGWFGEGNHKGPIDSDTCRHYKTKKVALFTSVITECETCGEVVDG